MLLNQKNKFMLQKRIFLKLGAVLCIAMVFVQSNALAKDAAENHASLALLSRAHNAALQLDYSGVFVFQQGTQVRTSRITHLRRDGRVLEKLEILDGQLIEYIRNGDEIICYLPAERRMILESRDTQKIFPALTGANPEKIERYYRIRPLNSSRVAGYDTLAITLEPKDALRYGYRLWADKSSGLLLRVQTLNEKHEVVEQIAFSHIAIGKIAPSRVKASFDDTRGWRIDNTMVSPLDFSKWAVKWMPDGFQRIRAVNRLITDQTPGHADGRREMAQLVYSDGLAGISIFIEPWSKQRSGAQLQQGALNVVGKRLGDFWLTIVGEVPLPAIRQVADSIELTATK